MLIEEAKAIVLAANPQAQFIDQPWGISFTETELWVDKLCLKKRAIVSFVTATNTWRTVSGERFAHASAPIPSIPPPKKKRLRKPEECLGKWVYDSRVTRWAHVIGTESGGNLLTVHDKMPIEMFSHFRCTLHDTPTGPDIGWEVEE